MKKYEITCREINNTYGITVFADDPIEAIEIATIILKQKKLNDKTTWTNK